MLRRLFYLQETIRKFRISRKGKAKKERKELQWVTLPFCFFVKWFARAPRLCVKYGRIFFLNHMAAFAGYQSGIEFARRH